MQAVRSLEEKGMLIERACEDGVTTYGHVELDLELLCLRLEMLCELLLSSQLASVAPPLAE